MTEDLLAAQAPAKLDLMLLRRIVELLPRFAYRYSDEVALHQGIADVLSGAGIAFQREVVAGPQDRFDLLVSDGIVIEAKVKGSLSSALHQVARYATRADVLAVVLVTTRLWAKSAARAVRDLHGKQVHVVQLRGSAF